MRRILVFFLGLLVMPAWSLGVHSIRGELQGAGKKKVFISGFYGEKVNRIDSVACDSAGRFVYNLGPATPIGLYRLSTGKDHFLDLIINDENIEFKCKGDLTPDSTVILSSNENKVYYFFNGFDRKIQAKLELILPLLDFYPEKDAFYMQSALEYEGIQKDDRRTLDSLSKVYPGSYAVRMFRIQQTPFLPSGITKDDRVAYLKQ